MSSSCWNLSALKLGSPGGAHSIKRREIFELAFVVAGTWGWVPFRVVLLFLHQANNFDEGAALGRLRPWLMVRISSISRWTAAIAMHNVAVLSWRIEFGAR